MASNQQILSEIAAKLNLLKCICSNTASNPALVVENYQPVNCSGDPVGTPLDVMPVITINKQDVSVCNTAALAEEIRGLYNIPVAETATTTWNASDNNDITKIHSISITITSATPTDTIDLIVNSGVPVTLPVGNNIYTATASTTFGAEFTLDTFVGTPTAVISIVKGA